MSKMSDMNALNNASINDENSSGLTSFAFPEAISSKTGVSVKYVPAEDKRWFNKCRFVSDDLVRVTFGPFEGVTGRVARVARQNRVVVYIKGLDTCITTAYIPSHYLEKVED